ncbi:MAG: hypothetical protein ACYCYD_12780, partial [Acidimicrobiales bacterium]
VPFGEPTGQLEERIVPTSRPQRSDPTLALRSFLPHCERPAPLPPLSALTDDPPAAALTWGLVAGWGVV